MKSKLIPHRFSIVVCLPLLITNLRAATITVTSTADSGAGTLRAALTSANNGDTINFGLPLPATIVASGGALSIFKSLTIAGPGSTNLVIQGGASGVFYLSGPNSITIAGLTITNGNTPYNGGGIDNEHCNLILSNVVLAGNSALNVGGGVFNNGNGTSATLTIINSLINGNTAGSGGGGIHSTGSGGSAAVLLTNCTLNGNSASSGAGISNDTGTLTIIDSVVNDNSADANCGGIYNVANGPGNIATAQVIRSVVSGNSAAVGTCGGIRNLGFNRATVRLAILDSTVDGNSASQDGGGIQNDNTADATATVGITNSTLSGNSSSIGAGIENLQGTSGTSAVWVVNCTLKDDSAPAGSGIYNQKGTIRLANTVLSERNSASISNYAGIVTSLGYNLCNDNGSGFLTHATDQINTDPMLGPLQDNGGPTFTHAPLPGSPAIDAGKNLSGELTDQRGLPRTFDKAAIANASGGDGTDIGAVESQSYTVVNTNDSGVGSLRQAIADSNAYPGTNTIDFAPSAYGTILLTSGELLITNSMLIAGPGATNELVNGNAMDRVFEIAPSNVVTISSLTITNGGNTNDPINGTFSGGGILNTEATLVISNCVVSGNRSFSSGGGIQNSGSSRASLALLSSVVSGNAVTIFNSNGGGIANSAGGSGNVGLHVTNSFISFNTALGGGGGIYNRAGNAGTAAVEVVDCTITGNAVVGQYGGGIENDITSSSTNRPLASISIINSTLSFNTNRAAVNAMKGGVFGEARLLIQNSTISSNFLYNNLIDGSPGAGGAVLNYQQNYNPTNTTVTILNSTVSKNSPGSHSTALYRRGLGVFVIGSSILDNGPPGADYVNIDHANSLGYNLCSDSGSGVLTNATDQLYTDPLLGALQDNGGPTLTHAPLPGSPAIDKGANFSASATDQRGFARTLDIAGIPNAAGGDGSDIGAVESKIAWLNNPVVISNKFGFDLIGPSSNTIIIEASPAVAGASWTALATNTLGDAALRFNDPTPPTLPQRFYRARVQ